MKIQGDIKKYYYYAFPMQAAIVTCTDEEGKTNPITVAWHTPISKKPPLYAVSIAPARYSHDLIKKSKEFVINFMPFELVDKVHFCGTHSGRNTNKIKETKLTLEPSKKIKTKHITESFAHLECTMYDTIKLGDHTLFVGEIQHLEHDEDKFSEKVIDIENFKPCYYLGEKIYTTVSKIKKKY